MSLTQSDRLLGRSAEESMLLNSYFASLTLGQDSPASVILIHGDSGLGKTKLAETLRPHVIEDDGYFIQGKFDQLSYGSANRPYSGISSAFAEYCNAVEQRSEETWAEVADKLRREIKGEDTDLLLEAIPSLRKIIGGGGSGSGSDSRCHWEKNGVAPVHHRRHSCDACQHVDNDEEEEMPESLDIFSENGNHRFIFLIKRVVSIISSIGDPIVCLIDDIQWANKTEQDVLKALMMGAINPFVFIFTCRPGNHSFLQITDEFGGKTDIVLQSLKRNSVRELVAEILMVDDVENCTSLANFISRVTNGNPFFIRQQIISLKDDGLIRYGNIGWVYDVDMIEEVHGDVMGNVVTTLSEKMKRLPSLTQEALKICSCIGSKIDLHVLGLLLREMHSVEGSVTEENDTFAKIAICMASQEGLLAITRNGTGVAFTHDSVNEAAYSLLEPDQHTPYHLKLGQILLRNVCPRLQRKYLFTIAAQLARGIELIIDDGDRIATARIFLSAGEKSMAASAFPEAHFFLSKGMKLLHDGDWSKNYRLCCDIYLKAADTAALMANRRDLEKWLSILFAHCQGSIVDFLNASYIQVRSMAERNDPDAVDVGLEALKLAGEIIPRSHLSMHTVIGFLQIRISIKNKGAEKLLQLPPIIDKQVIASLRLMNILLTISMGVDQKLLPVLFMRILRLNLTHGTSTAMPTAMALYSTALCRRGFPVDEVAKYGELALTLQDKLKCMSPNVSFLTYGTSFTLTKKLSDVLKPLESGYYDGVKTGDITHAMCCVISVGRISFFSGQRLRKVGKTLDKLRSSISEYNNTRALRQNRYYRNAIDYCLGVPSASRFFEPTGDADGCARTNSLLNEESKFIQIAVACIFCEHDLAIQLSEKLHQFGPIFAGTIWPYVCAFYRGMAATSMLHVTKSRKFIMTAMSCLKTLRKGRKRSVVNLSHQLCLLQAEIAVIRKKYSSAEKSYLLAIEYAAKARVIHEHAYACEKFGTYYLLRKKHNPAYEQMREAHRLYSKWGSRLKCKQLEKKFPKLGDEELFPPTTT